MTFGVNYSYSFSSAQLTELFNSDLFEFLILFHQHIIKSILGLGEVLWDHSLIMLAETFSTILLLMMRRINTFLTTKNPFIMILLKILLRCSWWSYGALHRIHQRSLWRSNTLSNWHSGQMAMLVWFCYFLAAFDSSWRHCSSWLYRLYRSQEVASLDREATLFHIQHSASDIQEHFWRHFGSLSVNFRSWEVVVSQSLT